jgi:hypothetical protein
MIPMSSLFAISALIFHTGARAEVWFSFAWHSTQLFFARSGPLWVVSKLVSAMALFIIIVPLVALGAFHSAPSFSLAAIVGALVIVVTPLFSLKMWF